MTTTAQETESLIERIERAEGPDRELDVLVEIECGPDRKRIKSIIATSPHNTINEVAKAADRYDALSFIQIPAYTHSLDAAMTLLPEGCWAEGALASPAHIEVHRNDVFDALGLGRAATPALALTAACLKARKP